MVRRASTVETIAVVRDSGTNVGKVTDIVENTYQWWKVVSQAP